MSDMSDFLKARDIKDVEAAVRWALAEEKSLEVVGRGTKRALGRPAQWDATLDLSALTGVTMYEPEELVLTAHAGTPLREIETLVDSRNQQLAFEPMDYGALLGGGGQASIGGALAANLSGPRRIKSGAARDHFLGFTAVSGRGEIFKSGGRVVKNVTGYDLSKLIAGSWGTLAVMTEVTIKVLPRAETEMTLVVQDLVDAGAMKAMAAAMGSACDVSGVAHLPTRIASQVMPGLGAGHAATVLRLEGVEPSVLHRARTLSEIMKSYGNLAMIDPPRSRTLWRAIRDVTPFAVTGPAGTYPVWRISTAPTNGAEVARLIAERIDAEFIYDWGGGLVWAVLAPSDDAGEMIVRGAVETCGGHATLVRAPAAIRATVPVFAPEEGGLAALTARVKESFDPKGVLNPGRMWAGV
jgi:glycolate oxidase FAD binding subunit